MSRPFKFFFFSFEYVLLLILVIVVVFDRHSNLSKTRRSKK